MLQTACRRLSGRLKAFRSVQQPRGLTDDCIAAGPEQETLVDLLRITARRDRFAAGYRSSCAESWRSLASQETPRQSVHTEWIRLASAIERSMAMTMTPVSWLPDQHTLPPDGSHDYATVLRAYRRMMPIRSDSKSVARLVTGGAAKAVAWNGLGQAEVDDFERSRPGSLALLKGIGSDIACAFGPGTQVDVEVQQPIEDGESADLVAWIRVSGDVGRLLDEVDQIEDKWFDSIRAVASGHICLVVALNWCSLGWITFTSPAFCMRTGARATSEASSQAALVALMAWSRLPKGLLPVAPTMPCIIGRDAR